MKKFVLVLLLVNSVLFSQDKSFLIKNAELEHDGITRYFDVFIPLKLKQNPELVIQLHGGNKNKDYLYDENGGASKYWKDIAEKNNFVLLVPNGIDTKTGNAKNGELHWNDCRIHDNDIQVDDVGFISKLIDWSVQNYKINQKKVFVTGVSNGGLMCYRLALEIPNKITAIAVFNANLYKESECKNTNISVPVMIVNGKKDKFMPFYGGKSKFRHEEVLSSQETVNFWVKNNFQSNNFPKKDIMKIGNAITYTIYDSENLHSQIRYYEIDDEGHNMPGKKYVLPKFSQRIVGKQNQEIEGAEIAWDFFKEISK